MSKAFQSIKRGLFEAVEHAQGGAPDGALAQDGLAAVKAAIGS